MGEGKAGSQLKSLEIYDLSGRKDTKKEEEKRKEGGKTSFWDAAGGEGH